MAIAPTDAAGGQRWTLTPTLTLSQAYTDNFRLSSANKQEDWISSVSPGIDLAVNEQTRGLFLSYSPSANFYQTHTQSNYLAHQGRLNGWSHLSGSTQLTIYDAFLRTEEPQTEATPDEELASQLGLQPDLTRRSSRQAYWQNTLGLSLAHRISPSRDLRLSYTFAVLNNDDPEVQDNTRHSPGLSCSHQFDGKNRAGLGLDYTRGEFSGASDTFSQYRPSLSYTHGFTQNLDGNLNYTHTIQDYSGKTPDYRIYHPTVGFSWRLAEDVPLSLNIGYFLQDRDSGDDKDGLTIGGDIGHGWRTRRSSLRISANSGYDQSFFGAENLGFNTFYQVMALGTHELSRFSSASFNASFRESDFVNDTSGRKDQALSAGMDFNFSFVKVKWLRAGLSYRYRDLSSSARGKDYAENRITFSLSAVPTRPLPLN